MLTPEEASTKKPVVLDQQVVEEKPFESTEMTVITYKNGSFANVSDCLYLYQRGGAVIVRTLGSKNRTEQIHHLTFEHEPLEKYRGKCEKNATHHQVFFSMRFNLMNGTENAGMLRVNGTVIKNKRGYWEMEMMRTKLYKLAKEFRMNAKCLETPMEFSYSCKAFAIHSSGGSGNDKMTLKFNNLQIQPFYTSKVFAESFDCSTLFTLGSWMGLIVVWIFTMVVAVGAYSLLSIKTMDRFDNAKGKSIVNVASTDQ